MPHVYVLGRAKRRVLDAVNDEWRENGNWPVTVSAVVRRTGLARSTAYVHLLGLTHAGYIVQGPERAGWRPA